MTRKRYSIYPSPDLARALQDRLVEPTEDGDTGAAPLRGRSATLTAIVVRYAEIVRRHTPLFTANEWAMIVDSLNGYWMNDNPQLAANGIALNVADNHTLNGAGATFSVDGLALARRIDALPFVEKVAIMDVSERFWAGAAQESAGYPELFTQLAGKLDTENTNES